MKRAAIFDPAPAKGWVPWALLTPVLCILFVVSTALGASAAVEGWGLFDANDEPIGRSGFMAMLLLPFGALGAVVLMWVAIVERRSLASIGLKDEKAGSTFGVGILIGIVMSAVVVAAIWWFGGARAAEVAPALSSGEALPYIVVLLAGFAVQSGVEEIVFRGWMLSAIARRFNVVAAIILVSITFTLLHAHRDVSPFMVANVFMFSVFACCWVLKTGNIWGVMGWHAGWNWLLGTGFGWRITGLDLQVPALIARMIPQGPDYLTGGQEGPEGSVVCGAFFAAASLLLMASRGWPQSHPLTSS